MGSSNVNRVHLGHNGRCTMAGAEWQAHCTMRFGSTAKVLPKCKLKYYRISECIGDDDPGTQGGYASRVPVCCVRIVKQYQCFPFGPRSHSLRLHSGYDFMAVTGTLVGHASRMPCVSQPAVDIRQGLSDPGNLQCCFSRNCVTVDSLFISTIFLSPLFI